MSLEITPKIEEMVRAIFHTGQYETEAQVLHEALNLLKKRDRLRLDLHWGLSELDSGDRIADEEVFAELEEKASQLPEANQ